MRPARRRAGRWGCALALLMFTAVCCTAPLTGAISALAALNNAQDDNGIAEGGTAADIPPRMLTAYQHAARTIGRYAPKCRGMRWPVLAGIAQVESHHAAGHRITAGGDIRPKIYGALLDGSGAGGNATVFPDTDGGRWDGTARGERAVGPFQFMPATWDSIGQDGNGDQVADPHNADDAALSAAVYLCGGGRNLADRDQLKAAVFQYNHSTAYVADVLGWIDQYTAAAHGPPNLQRVTGPVRTVIEAALSQRGIPYSWGGGTIHGAGYGICCSPSGKSGAAVRGFDCSGLTLYAYAQAGIGLPRTAAAQAGVGRRIPARLGTGALQPGDLVFYAYAPGRDATIYHVGIYLGGGQMIDAPRPGTVVRVDGVDTMPGYAGGARPL
ncbi:C40 family peptidase [Streptomyces sp. NPDC086766]|uniref:C40 family peptidase n=1 Tax=Streptomyces sp. NPDC086766 TaxID=3365754 RepID=UPI003822B472